MTTNNTIRRGDLVRSFDFHFHDLSGERACYVIGTVLGTTRALDGTPRYAIAVEACVWQGVHAPGSFAPGIVFPPINGLPSWLGESGVTDGVERILALPAPAPKLCVLCGQRIDDGLPCGCGARPAETWHSPRRRVNRPKVAKFHVSPVDGRVIDKLVDRAVRLRITDDPLATLLDLRMAHARKPLDLEGLLAAADFHFIHDIAGIARHIDRETGDLRNCFTPRFTYHEVTL